MADNERKPPEPPNLNTVGEKSREAQNYGSSTSANSQHNYQTSNATEPEQLAQMGEENLKRFEKKSDAANEGAESSDDFRQHDAGG